MVFVMFRKKNLGKGIRYVCVSHHPNRKVETGKKIEYFFGSGAKQSERETETEKKNPKFFLYDHHDDVVNICRCIQWGDTVPYQFSYHDIKH